MSNRENGSVSFIVRVELQSSPTHCFCCHFRCQVLSTIVILPIVNKPSNIDKIFGLPTVTLGDS